MNAVYRCCLCVLGSALLFAVLTPGCGTDSYDNPPQSTSPPAESHPAPEQPADPPLADLPVWEPDAELLEKLEPYQDVGDYEIRLPKGFNSVEAPPNKPGMYNFAWGGPISSQGVVPLLRVTIGELAKADPQTASEFKAESLKQIFEKLGQNLENDNDGNNTSPSEFTYGQLHGEAVLRVRAEVPKPLWPVEAETIWYAYRDQDRNEFVLMQFVDSKTNFKSTSELGTASLLSFRKKQ